MLLRDKSRKIGRLEDNALCRHNAPRKDVKTSGDPVALGVHRGYDGLIIAAKTGAKTLDFCYIKSINMVADNTEVTTTHISPIVNISATGCSSFYIGKRTVGCIYIFTISKVTDRN